MENDNRENDRPVASLSIIFLMYTVCACALGTIGYFLADYMAARSELSIVERRISQIERDYPGFVDDSIQIKP